MTAFNSYVSKVLERLRKLTGDSKQILFNDELDEVRILYTKGWHPFRVAEHIYEKSLKFLPNRGG